MLLPALEFYSQLLLLINLGFVIIALFYLWKGKKSFFYQVDDDLSQAKKKSAEILQTAIEKADDIVVEAELKGIESIASHKLTAEKANTLYKDQLAEVLEKVSDQFANTVGDIESELKTTHNKYNSILDNFTAALERMEEVQTDVLRKELDAVLEQFRSDLSAVPQEVRDSLLKYAEGEKTRINDSLRDYEKKRKRFVDEHIAQLLEDLIRLTLERSIDLDQHVEIVEQSLKKAQEEGFFSDA